MLNFARHPWTWTLFGRLWAASIPPPAPRMCSPPSMIWRPLQRKIVLTRTANACALSAVLRKIIVENGKACRASLSTSLLEDDGSSSGNPLTIEISADVIRKVLKNLPQGSACGASGWTFATIRFAFQERDVLHNDRIEVLRTFVAALLAGHLCPDHLLTSRAVLIPKDDTKYRPLGIGESWYRFAARVASSLLAHSVGRSLPRSSLAAESLQAAK